MRGKVFSVAVALGMVLGGSVKASAEIYLWTDERGVVHMTNQWATVPESARARVSVRDSAPEGTLAPEPASPPVEPRTGTQPPFPVLPDLAQTPPTAAPSPSILLYPGESSV